jgi:hypothetical protein
MNVRAKAVLLFSSALPVMALAAFLLLQPQKLVSADIVTCIYDGQTYPQGAVISATCPTGKVQTCLAQSTWSGCNDAVQEVKSDQ